VLSKCPQGFQLSDMKQGKPRRRSTQHDLTSVVHMQRQLLPARLTRANAQPEPQHSSKVDVLYFI
jgi:hypothetical protein